MFRLSVKITRPSSPLPGPRLMRQEMRAIGRRIAKEIRDRTRRGRDVYGLPFRPLASGEPSRLRETGKMLRSLRARRFHDRGFVIAPSQRWQNLAAAHQRGRGTPRRQWVGVTRGQIETFVRAARRAFYRAYLKGKDQ